MSLTTELKALQFDYLKAAQIILDEIDSLEKYYYRNYGLFDVYNDDDRLENIKRVIKLKDDLATLTNQMAIDINRFITN